MLLAILLLLLASATFYWYDLRPRQIRTDCFAKAAEFDARRKESMTLVEDRDLALEHELFTEAFDRDYDLCLRRHGLKP